MEETSAQPTPSEPAASQPPPSETPQPAPAEPAAQPSAERPDWLPEKFWLDGAPNVEGLAKSYSELEKGRTKIKEDLTKEITEQVTTAAKKAEEERRAAAPAAPEAYQVAIPDGTEDVVLLDAQPGPDFQPEAGKTYAIINKESPLLKNASALAHKYAIPQEEFSAVIADLAREMGYTPPTEDEIAAQKQAIYEKLGEHGAARADHAWKGMQSVLGEKANALDAVLSDPAAIEAMESLLERTGQAKFSPGNIPSTPQHTEEELKAMAADPRYNDTNHPEHKAYREKVDRLFKEFYD